MKITIEDSFMRFILFRNLKYRNFDVARPSVKNNHPRFDLGVKSAAVSDGYSNHAWCRRIKKLNFVVVVIELLGRVSFVSIVVVVVVTAIQK